ncbi:MAG: nucleoside deaminase [Candidatus Thiodiazotropha sp.]
MADRDAEFMHEALALARHGIEQGHGGPFGAVVVHEGRIVGRGWNQVIKHNDPTAHAEMQAIREACRTLETYHLSHAVLYTTCQPCPMCLSAAYWAHISRLVYAAEAEDAAAIGFDDHRIEEELKRPQEQRSMPSRQILRDESLKLFELWSNSALRTEY